MDRALRIGVVLHGELVEERVFTKSPITFGQSLRCELSVPIDGLPREHLLFAFERGHWRHHAMPAMEVVVDGGRGKLTLGEVTILFQEIATPARPQLPPEMRATLAERVDRRLAVIVGGSLLVHLAIASWAWMQDVEQRPLGTPAIAMYQEIDVTLPDLTPPPTTAVAPGPGVAAPAAPSRQTPRAIVQRPASGADAQRLATILTGDEAGETGRTGMRKPGADLNEQIRDARNVTIGDGTHTSRSDDSAHIDDHRAPLVESPQRTETVPHRDEKAHGWVRVGTVKPETQTSLTPALVLEWINTRYMVGLSRCYRLGLTEDSTLAGRVSISFTVDYRGRVIDPSASGVSTGVDACISKQMGAWRFPIPRDKGGDKTDASFAVSLALQPS